MRTKKEFVPGAYYHTFLFKDKETEIGFSRLDVLEEIAGDILKNESPTIHWKAVFELPPPPPPPLLKKETAEEQLKALLKSEHDVEKGVAYLFAIWLERKKILVERDRIIEMHQEKAVYENPKSGETLLINVVRVTDEIFPAAQERLKQLLGGKSDSTADNSQADETQSQPAKVPEQ